MTEEIEVNLTSEEKLEKAQGHLNVLVLATIRYLKENNLSLDEFWQFVGQKLAPGWSKKLTAVEFAKREAAFLIAVGCNLLTLSGDEFGAEAVFEPWPSDADWKAEKFLEFFELTPEDADPIWGMYGPVANHLGLDYHWTREEDGVKLTFLKST